MKRKMCAHEGCSSPAWSKGMCQRHGNKKPAPKAKKKTTFRLKKPTGEGAFFKMLWETRRHVCFSCGRHLGEEARTFHFSHVIKKSRRPDLRLTDTNVVLECLDCHNVWDQGDMNAIVQQPSFARKMEIIKRLDEEFYEIMLNNVACFTKKA